MTIYHFQCLAPVAVMFLVGAVASWRSGLM